MFHKLPHSRLRPVKFFPRYDALMGVLHGDPVLTADLDGVRVAYPVPYPFSKDVFTKVAFITENLYNSGIRPEVVFFNAGPACPGAARRPLIKHGRWHSFPVQRHGDLVCAVSTRRQMKDAPYCLRRFRVYDQPGLISRVLDIAIGGEGREKVPPLGAELLRAPYLPGQVPAIKVIQKGLEGGFQAVHIGGPDAVKAIVDGDKPHSQEGEHAGNVVADSQVITAKAG